MKFPFLASFIVFVFWLTYELYKHKNDQAKIDEPFWEKESLAEKAFMRDLNTLPYIQIPLDLFPFHLMKEDEQVQDYQETILALTKLRIMNFTGISNTDLKLSYGAGNIDSLMEYDHNFTLLARVIGNFSKKLYLADFKEEAQSLMEYGVSLQIDFCSCYYLLASIYQSKQQPEKISELITTAEKLNSLLKKTIVRNLKKYNQARD